MSAIPQRNDWRQIAVSVFNLLAAGEIPASRRGWKIKGSITFRVRPHPHCGAPVLEVLSPGVRGGLALNWREFRKLAVNAHSPRRIYTVSVNCPTLNESRTYKIENTSSDRAWRAGLRRFFQEFPQALTNGLVIGGSSKT